MRKNKQNYRNTLIEEHSQLMIKIIKLTNYLNSAESEKDDKIEFINKVIQLKGMNIYCDALEARMANADIVFEDGQYLNRVAQIDFTPENQSSEDDQEILETTGENDNQK